MKIRLIRHATILIDINGQKILVDPMLSEAGKMPAVPGVANTSDNPLVNLTVHPSTLINADAILVTHTHRDHLDDAAMQLLPHSTRLFCQAPDGDIIREAGFTNVQIIDQSQEWKGITISRTEGRHGTGSIGKKMGPVSGFMLKAEGEPSLYITGDTIWCPEVQYALEKFCPQIVICFAGAAQFSSGDPITMTKEDIMNVCKHAPSAKIVVIHMEAWNHCLLTRKELQEYVVDNSLIEQVYIPDDGEWVG
jgi:L-ascorbate metabolism protein UlaG (beta-lactamase superfamily)